MLVPDIAEDFAGVQLGDVRITNRLMYIARVLQLYPDNSYPKSFMNESDTDTFYRFVRNENVDQEKIINEHIKKTNQRASSSKTVLILHDSTNIIHGESGDGKDFYEVLNKTYGYIAHVGLCVDCDTKIPLGISNLECVERDDNLRANRQKQSDVDRWLNENKESLRWVRGVRSAKECISGKRIHVMDREGDSYQLLCEIIKEDESFVVRACYDRNMLIENKKSKISTITVTAPVFATREVHLSKRVSKNNTKSNKPRQERDAVLTIRAFQGEIMKSTLIPASIDIQSSIHVNVVIAKEENPPPEQEAVCWVLLTTEPIDSPENVLRVVDIYRKRWMIEDLFKALKTGCSFSNRQFESQKTSQTALSITLPIAWRLLLIRQLARDAPDLPALTLLSSDEIDVLATIQKKSPSTYKTVRDVWRGIAEIGGYLRHKRPPGWLVLGRGFARLMEYCSIVQMMRQKLANQDPHDP